MLTSEYDYFHCTSNNTIFGTQMHEFPNSPIPMVCDMSSDVFSRTLNFKQFDLIYAGAQKNMGPAGTVMVAIKKDILGKVSRVIPTMLNYQTHIAKDSMFNTPSVFAVYGVYQTLRWIKKLGLEHIEERNRKKANRLYEEIDQNELFSGTAAKEDRSMMNVTFVLNDENLNAPFLEACKEAGISGIKGHRSVGGFRASMYNAMELEAIEVLIGVMRTFTK